MVGVGKFRIPGLEKLQFSLQFSGGIAQVRAPHGLNMKCDTAALKVVESDGSFFFTKTVESDVKIL